MAGIADDADLLERLAAASGTVARALRDAGVDPEVAAAACAALAGEYTALVAAAQGLALAPLLREAAATLKRRGAEIHGALLRDAPARRRPH